MTDEQRELAEYVARWAGWESRRYSPYHEGLVWTRDPGNPNAWGDVEPEQVLTDDALAFRALVEVIRGAPTLPMLSPEPDGSWFVVRPDQGSHWTALLALGEGPTPHEAIFRAHRAVREG